MWTVARVHRQLGHARSLTQFARAHADDALGVKRTGPFARAAAADAAREDGAVVAASASELELLRQLESKANWLSCLMVHNANNVRPKRDGLKVGGHQASSASLSTILTVLYARVLAPQDRVAVKPHAAPLYHALQYMMGRQTLANLQAFRALGGVQAYPSRTKDLPQVDFSTGSVGMGVGVTVFAALAQSYLKARGLAPKPWPGTAEAPRADGRMVSVIGDAELDEGIVFEALLESWKHDVPNAWCIVDYNRQSLDQNVRDGSQRMAERLFRLAGWEVVTVKYGKRLRAAFEQPGGKALQRWLNQCDNATFSALTFRSGAAWREAMLADLPGLGEQRAPLEAFLATRSDDALHALMTDLGGHCPETLLEAFAHASASSRRTAFIMYTIKGHDLPLAGHRDNHGLFMTAAQMETLRAGLGVAAGADEWAPFAPTAEGETARRLLEAAPINQPSSRDHGLAERVEIPADLAPALCGGAQPPTSTQAAFGAVLKALAHSDCALADRIVSACPDVTTTTGLSSFVNKRGVFAAGDKARDSFKSAKAHSLSNWSTSASGQHVELGISENNLLLLLAAFGLSAPLFGHRLFPIGCLYDAFISRALDALTYACYNDARFMLVGTPSGITLAPEGGAHQSLSTPLVGLSMPNLLTYEPAFADEVSALMRHGFERMQRASAEGGGSVYLRLSTRVLAQPDRRLLADGPLHADVLAGAYWHAEPTDATRCLIAFAGAVAPEAAEAAARTGAALLQVTSYDALAAGWRELGDASHVARLLARVPRAARVVTVLDGHPVTLAWLGSVHGHRTRPLGVSAFGQSADLPDLYALHGINADAIVRACDA